MIAGDKLRAIVERIERIEEEIKELVEGKKEIYFEAKGNGFDVKILREVIRVRKQDQKQREEQESCWTFTCEQSKERHGPQKRPEWGRVLASSKMPAPAG